MAHSQELTASSPGTRATRYAPRRPTECRASDCPVLPLVDSSAKAPDSRVCFVRCRCPGTHGWLGAPDWGLFVTRYRFLRRRGTQRIFSFEIIVRPPRLCQWARAAIVPGASAKRRSWTAVRQSHESASRHVARRRILNTRRHRCRACPPQARYSLRDSARRLSFVLTRVPRNRELRRRIQRAPTAAATWGYGCRKSRSRRSDSELPTTIDGR